MSIVRSKLLVIIGTLLILCAAVLYGYNTIDENRAKSAADELLSGLDKAQGLKISDTENSISTAKVAEIQSLDVSEQVVSVDGIDMIGSVFIPKIDIKLPVASGWSYKILKKASCRYSGTARDGKLIVLAHNYNKHFGKLSKL